MLQEYVLSVLNVSEACFICVFQMHVAFVFIWMLHVFFGCCVWLQSFSSVFQVFQAFQMHVAFVSYGCCKSRSGDVAHVVYVAIICFECFRCIFHLCLSGLMLQLCLSGCCICFTHTLHAFYLDVAYGCNGFQVCFRCVFQVFH